MTVVTIPHPPSLPLTPTRSAGEAILYDARHHVWLTFANPQEIITAAHLAEVQPALQRLEEVRQSQQLYAVGFVSYEAAPALDEALVTRPADPDFPLVWFGVYNSVRELSEPPCCNKYNLGTWEPTIGREQYVQTVQQIKQYIAQGDTYQINYSFRLRANFAGDSRALFLDLTRSQPSRYMAWINTGRYAICSASPELFFKYNGQKLTARPMKGTAKRGLTSAQDLAQSQWLQNDPKNRAENVMIVDMVRHDMGRVAEVGTVHVPHLFQVEQYPTVWQMTSTVECQTTATLPQIFSALFPCASITGAPKARTMQFIQELENSPRRVYTGAVGMIHKSGRIGFNVAIRTVLIDQEQGTAEYGLGSGVVWDSDPEEEFAECLLKAEALKAVRPEFELLETMRWTPREGYWLLERHLQRLQSSAHYFGFALDEPNLRQRLEALAGHLWACPHRVRVRLAAGGDVQLESEVIRATRPTLKLAIAQQPMPTDDALLYHKTSYRRPYEQIQAQHPGADDVVLWNPAGYVTETCIGNIAIQKGNRWITPPVSDGLLAGTYRAQLLAEGWLVEQSFTLAELKKAAEVVMFNSVRGWCPAVLENSQE